MTIAGLFLSCQHSASTSKADRHYPMTGKVVSIDPQHQTATIDAAAIPNYMEAMTMEYPVKSKADLKALHVGEQISATVDVTADESYSLSNVRPGNGAK
jgi:protein SCO1/2